ncbi:MAG: hypothetical protein LBV41_12530 [Cytophagaceae bacterium]|jgi:ornithine cyclodeaminase/alanine dehydrogenase-like protein (mu-crystallin family)|nr:hypothetical protein [Cytophagaceae bacterium]
MKVIATREIRSVTKTFFELAEKERFFVKIRNKHINLIVSDNPEKTYVDEDCIRQFMNIPAEYRVNQFELSPSGDLFFADKRNIAHIAEARKGQTKRLSKEEQKEFFGL